MRLRKLLQGLRPRGYAFHGGPGARGSFRIGLSPEAQLVDNVYMNRTKVANVNKKAAEVAVNVFETIHTLMHLFRSEQYRVLREGRYHLTHMEGKILGFFIRHPGATLRDLVAHLRQDKGQLARLIRSLKDQQLLEAQSDAGDRRSVPLHPTREGRGVHQILQRQVRKLSAVAIKGLSASERRQLVVLLHKVRSNLEGIRGTWSAPRRSD
jgi:DNA-binding MarR family transcriptional regulator